MPSSLAIIVVWTGQTPLVHKPIPQCLTDPVGPRRIPTAFGHVDVEGGEQIWWEPDHHGRSVRAGATALVLCFQY